MTTERTRTLHEAIHAISKVYTDVAKNADHPLATSRDWSLGLQHAREAVAMLASRQGAAPTPPSPQVEALEAKCASLQAQIVATAWLRVTR